jgi:hypothetical protein
MKLNNKIKKAAICVSLLAAVSCTGDFESVNTNSAGASDELLAQDFGNVKAPLKVIFNNILVQMPEWKYQVQQGLQGDIWSGYMATGTAFASGSNNTTYNLIDGWNGFAWGSAYSDVMANVYKVEQLTKEKYPQVYGMALVLKVQAMHRIADIYGPCVYSKFGSTEKTVEYDSQQEAYMNMLKDLDTAVGILSAAADSGEKSIIASSDKSTYAGDYAKWTRLANSLRLRLALRLAKVDNATYKAESAKALNQKYGVMSTNADSFILVSDTKNPINTISGGWGDILMSADMESILGGYNDKRITKYFDESAIVAGEYKGVRTGIQLESGAHSKFSRVGAVVKTNQIVFMSTAQVYLMRAEVALREGSALAKSYYEAGILASFEQNGLTAGEAATYISDNTSTAKDYVDTIDPLNNATAVNNVKIAWDDTASNEVKLQKIITQKWIAGFPEGQEAWTEYRRTGYPKLFPVLKNTSNGVISSTLGVRRVNFVQSEKDGNPGGVATGVTKLGGPDNGATRLWWDTGVNF